MKRFFISYILPSIVAVFIFLKIAAYPKTNELLFAHTTKNVDTTTTLSYIENFASNSSSYQDWFLKSEKNKAVIFLLGSSELGHDNEATPYRFINKYFSTKLNAVGNAGNQSFSIYSQLLANEELLKNAPIVIIISPLWFQKNYAQGTNPNCFLQYTTEKFLNKIIHNDSVEEFKNYELKRISDFYSTYGSPTIGMRNAYILNSASKNYFSNLLFSPVIFTNTVFQNFSTNIMRNESAFYKKTAQEFKRFPIIQDSLYINWDSLLAISKAEAIKKATNNKWYINNDYYDNYVKGEQGSVTIIEEKDNQELTDFEMLLKLVHAKKVNASFVILPMNPYYYKNLSELTPLVSSLEKRIKDDSFNCLNLWAGDTTTFEKGVLTDIMHLSSNGWYKVDKFIVETYSLNKYE
jgi:D-alanine transfer protein